MRKRGQGEGNIYRRSDGRWAARISAGYRNGKRSRRWVYGETRSEVAVKLRELLRSAEEGSLPEPGRTTVAQFLDRWLSDVAAPRLRAKTVLSYRQVIRLHITPHIGHVVLQKLTPQQVQAWMAEVGKGHVSPRTVGYARSVLRSALTQAVRWGVVQRNVATLVDPPRVVRPEIRPLDEAQARSLLKVAGGHRLHALFAVAVALGLRQGEALGLQWSDVDYETQTIHVRRALQRIGPGWQLVEPKSTRSRRSIAMPGVVTDALRAHKVRQLEDRLVAGSEWQEHGFVFTSRTGTPLEGRNVSRVLATLLKEASLPSIRFHDLRHTAATLLLAMGVDPRTIMETLGHSQISLTLNTYSHVLPAMQREAAKRMDRALVG